MPDAHPKGMRTCRQGRSDEGLVGRARGVRERTESGGLTASRFWPGDKGVESGQDEGASWEVLRSSCKVQPSPGDCPLSSEVPG